METLDPNQLSAEAAAEYQRKAYLSAAGLYTAAAEGFLAAGDEVRAAEMANDCSVAYLKGGDAQAALQAAAGSEDVFTSAGDTKGQAVALGNQAAALEKLKRNEEALAMYEKSAQLLQAAGETELRAYVLQAISSLYMKKRRYLEAYAVMRAGIMGLEKPDLKQRLLKALIQIPFKLLP